MKTFILPLLLCLFGFANLQAQTSILVKDTSGIEHRIIIGKTKITLVLKDAPHQKVRGKLVSYNNGNFLLSNGTLFNTERIDHIELRGPKEKAHRALANYYFCSINGSLGIMFWVAGNGWGTLIVDALVIVVTPVTMVLVPVIISRNNHRLNPTIIPMKGNFK